MKLLEFFIDIIIRDRKAVEGLDNVEKKSKGAKKGLEGIGGSAERASLKLAGLAVSLFSVSKAFSSTVGSGANFQAQVNAIQAFTGASSDEIDLLEEKARELGRSTKFSATEAAKGIEMLARNGIQTDQILGGALDSTLALASAMGEELGPTADFMTDIMGQFNIVAEKTPEVVNLIAGAARSSKFDMNQLWQAFAQAGGTAGSLGIELEEFLATISLISPAFKSGSDAGTSLKVLLSRLPGLTKPAIQQLESLGMEFFDMDGNLKSMPEIIQEMRDGLNGLSDEASIIAVNDLFGVDAMRVAVALAKTEASDYEDILKRIKETSAKEMSDKRMEGLIGSWKEFKSAVESLQITIFESGLGDYLERLVDKTTGIIKNIESWILKNPEIVGQIGEIASAIAPWLAALVGIKLAIFSIKSVFKLLGITAIAEGGKSVSAWMGISAVLGVLSKVSSAFKAMATVAITQAAKAATAWKTAAAAGQDFDMDGPGKKNKFGKLGKVAKVGGGAAAALALTSVLSTSLDNREKSFEKHPEIAHLQIGTVHAKYLSENPEMIEETLEEFEKRGSFIKSHPNTKTAEFIERQRERSEDTRMDWSVEPIEKEIVDEKNEAFSNFDKLSNFLDTIESNRPTPDSTIGASTNQENQYQTKNIDASVNDTNIVINVEGAVDPSDIRSEIEDYLDNFNNRSSLLGGG